MNKKKVIRWVVILVIVVALTIGVIFGVKAYQKSKLVADVVPVSYLNYGNYEYMESEGVVSNNASQYVYVSPSQTISEVYVENGQEVKQGDPLLAYDVSSLSLSVEIKRLEVEKYGNEITATQREIDVLKNTTPIPDTLPTPEPKPKKAEDSYLYLEGSDLDLVGPETVNPVFYKGEGTKEDPYHILCSMECEIYGSFYNAIKMEGYDIVLDITEDNKESGIVDSKVLSPDSIPTFYSDTSKWSLLTGCEVVELPMELPEGYTSAELKTMIEKKEQELKRLDVSKRKAELQLKEMEDSLEDGVVYAQMDGTIKDLKDPENIPNDGSAFLVLSGKDGLYVKGNVSELNLDQIQVGQSVTANCWSNGQGYMATITSIDNYPDPNPSYWGNGNPNVTYYAYTAYIENPDGLQAGDGLTLTIDDLSSGNGGIYLQSCYIRQEDGKSYVYKDQDGKLVKQRVTTGKIVDSGYAIEIISGITEEDFLAFPYGKTAKEGVTTKQQEDGNIFY